MIAVMKGLTIQKKGKKHGITWDLTEGTDKVFKTQMSFFYVHIRESREREGQGRKMADL